MPKLTGMAMSRAIAEVTSVPTIGTSAPNPPDRIQSRPEETPAEFLSDSWLP
jgi:hypothetical protein